MRVIWFNTENLSFESCRHLAGFVAENRQRKIQSLKREEDKVNSLFLDLLMRYSVSERFSADPWKLEFETEPYGKPFCAGFPRYAFSVSHSGSRVVFCEKQEEGGAVGVDVEKIEKAKFAAVETHFADFERKHMEKAQNRDRAFFEIWTRKEAYFKMLGTGLREPLGSFDSFRPASAFHMKTIEKEGYILSAVCKGKGEKFWQLRELTWKELKSFLCRNPKRGAEK